MDGRIFRNFPCQLTVEDNRPGFFTRKGKQPGVSQPAQAAKPDKPREIPEEIAILRRTIALLALLLIPGSSSAEIGFGGTLGNVHISYDSQSDAFDYEDSDLSYKLFADFRVHGHIGFESAYHSLGRTDLPTVPDYGGTLDNTAVSISAKGFVPISKLCLFGKVGYLSWKRSERQRHYDLH